MARAAPKPQAGRSAVPSSQIVWHNQGVSAAGEGSRDGNRRRRTPPLLDAGRIEELALRYVSRFATTRSKLRNYLTRKLRERGWDGEQDPDLDALVDRFARLGYVDDAAFAKAKASSLSARGYGMRRVRQALAQAGVSESDGEDARNDAEGNAVEAALRFARRRKIGPFASAGERPTDREKALAAMVRAGHGFGLARLIVDTEPDQELDEEALLRFRS